MAPIAAGRWYDLEKLDRELESAELYQEFYHALLKKYVDLAWCTFVLERLVSVVYREERFCSRFTGDIFQEIIEDLES